MANLYCNAFGVHATRGIHLKVTHYLSRNLDNATLSFIVGAVFLFFQIKSRQESSFPRN